MPDSTQAFRHVGRHPAGGYLRDDVALLDGLRAGADSALSTLHERHVRAVYGVVADRLGAGLLAEEATHDVFLMLWRKCRRITLAGTSCLPWLIVTADSLAKDLFRNERSRRRRWRQAAGAAEEIASHRSSDGWCEVERIIATLAWADREVFRLCTEEGLGYRQAVRRVRDDAAEWGER